MSLQSYKLPLSLSLPPSSSYILSPPFLSPKKSTKHKKQKWKIKILTDFLHLNHAQGPIHAPMNNNQIPARNRISRWWFKGSKEEDDQHSDFHHLHCDNIWDKITGAFNSPGQRPTVPWSRSHKEKSRKIRRSHQINL